MANAATASMISAEFWALLHRMGLPKETERAVITLAADDFIRVTADFALTDENGELKLVEGALEKASAGFVFVREEELEAMRASLDAHREAAKQPGHD